jgi:DNA-binding response OmpR family regulator
MAARILVIEHQALQLAAIHALLACTRHDVVVAREGIGGVAAARRQRPNLILCAIAHPVNGVQVLCTLRTDAAFDRTPIVAATFLSTPSDRMQLLSLGFDGVIAKPLRGESFVAEVEAFLRA